jgi:precorrin-6B methylase 2
MNHPIITFVFAVFVIGLSVVMLILEYYYTKTKVTAVSSLPWMRKAVVKVLKEQLHNHKSDSPKVIYEMGSGWGPLAIDAARTFPQAHIIGLELSPIPLWFSRIRCFLFGHKNVTFKMKDFFDEDLSDADIILLYMLESVLTKLEPKFIAELKPGTVIVSNTFEIRGWKPVHVENVMKKPLELNVYMYRVPDSVPQSDAQ